MVLMLVRAQSVENVSCYATGCSTVILIFAQSTITGEVLQADFNVVVIVDGTVVATCCDGNQYTSSNSQWFTCGSFALNGITHLVLGGTNDGSAEAKGLGIDYGFGLGINVVGEIEGDGDGRSEGIPLGMDVMNSNIGESEGTADGVVLGNNVVGKGVGESDC